MEGNSKKRFLFHPSTTFLILGILTIIISGIASAFGLQATYTRINPITGELQPYLVAVESLVSREGLQFIVGDALRNFISFAPLSMALIFLLSLGVLEKSGLLKAIINRISSPSSKMLNTFIIFLAGILLSIFNEMAYTVIIPLAALFFLLNKRNPLTGVVVGFASVSFGYSINVLVNSMDILLMNYTNMAANIVDINYNVGLYSNLFIMIVATILLSLLGTFVTEKYIIRKIGKYNIELSEEEVELNKRGILYATIAGLITLFLIVYMIIPDLPYSGILLNYDENTYLDKLLSPTSSFYKGLPALISGLIFIISVFYGLGAKTFKKNTDITNAMNTYMAIAGNIIIIAFFASQFIAYFKRTNLGTVIAAWGAQIIKGIEFSGIPLIIVTIIVIAIVNLFVTSTTLKWSIISPVVIPILMQLNLTPEFSEVLLKVGDSITNGITPLLAQFAIFVAFLNHYNKDEVVPIRKALSLTIPYSISFAILWLIIIISWYIIGLPIGPGVYPTV